MIHHLASFGWPYLLLAAMLATFATRPFAAWMRYEIRLWRRARRRDRLTDIRLDGPRSFWPPLDDKLSTGRSLPRPAETPPLAELDRRSDLAVTEMTIALDAVENAMLGKPVR